MADPSNVVLGVDNTFRRKFDREEYLRRARVREEREAEGRRHKSKAKGPSLIQKKSLKQRNYRVDFESRVGKTQLVSPVAPLSQQAGFACPFCQCVVKDSASYLDHINGEKHQRALGMPKRVERASVEQVQQRLKRKNAASFSEQDFDQRILMRQLEEQERKRQRRERKKEKKKKMAAEAKEAGEDPDVAAMMGFGGFLLVV